MWDRQCQHFQSHSRGAVVNSPIQSSGAVPRSVRDSASDTVAISEGFVSLGTVDMVFFVCAHVMKSPPQFFSGAYRAAIRIALKENQCRRDVE